MNDRGIVTIIVSILAILFSMGTLLADVVLNKGRNHNLFLHDLQVDRDIFHKTLFQFVKLSCLDPDFYLSDQSKARSRCRHFTIPQTEGIRRELLLQKSEFLEAQIENALREVHEDPSSSLTPIDFRILAKGELLQLNFKQADIYVHQSIDVLNHIENASTIINIRRHIRANLMKGWLSFMEHGEENQSGRQDFDQAISEADQEEVSEQGERLYYIVYILQSRGCADVIAESLHHSINRQVAEDQKFFSASETILSNKIIRYPLLTPLKNQQKTLEASGQVQLNACYLYFRIL